MAAAKKANKAKKPNILVIWGDDIGQSNLSCYTHGLMGYRTRNIDRLADEGMIFTDCYGEQSYTLLTGTDALTFKSNLSSQIATVALVYKFGVETTPAVVAKY